MSISKNGPLYDLNDYIRLINLIHASKLSSNDRLHQEDVEKVQNIFISTQLDTENITATRLIASRSKKTFEGTTTNANDETSGPKEEENQGDETVENIED